MHLIDIERRNRDYESVKNLYKKLMKEIPKNRKSLRNWISMKMARFQYKVADEPEEALKTLRLATFSLLQENKGLLGTSWVFKV